MPRYKVNEKTYNLPEDKVEGFLLQFPDAVAIEDEAQDFPTSTPADADAVQQPMTASQAGFTESPSVDTPSESLDPDPIVKKNTLNTFVEIKPTEKNEDDDDRFTFENKKVNTNDLEKVGFEITEERSLNIILQEIHQ